MFQLTRSEVTQMNRSQIVIGSQKHRDPRFRPYTFTEQGIAILSSNLPPLLTGRRFLWFDRNVSEALEANQSWLGAFRFRNELALGIVHVNLWIFFRLR